MIERAPGFVVAVVDDDHSILRSLADLLESADYSVRVFTSAGALLENHALDEVDCIISDIDMPEMDGFDLLRRVHELRPGLPTILITGYPETLKQLSLADAGNPRVFAKPFSSEELLTAVSDALDGRIR